jgi:hypothetical protein
MFLRVFLNFWQNERRAPAQSCSGKYIAFRKGPLSGLSGASGATL